jgi:hypothetical protein
MEQIAAPAMLQAKYAPAFKLFFPNYHSTPV